MTMSFFKRIFGKDETTSKNVKAVDMKPVDYPPKIILAWTKAIEGEAQFLEFLLNNGYEELYHTTQALKLKTPARDWLMANGYPQLMALVNAAEGNESAWTWLNAHDMDLLLNIGKAADGEPESFAWLKNNATEDLFLLALAIKQLKDQIESNHNDMHSYRKDL